MSEFARITEWIARKDAIDAVGPDDKGSYKVVFRSGHTLSLSRSEASELIKELMPDEDWRDPA